MLDTRIKNLTSIQLRELETFARKINKFGAHFAVYTADGELVLFPQTDTFESEKDRLIKTARRLLKQNQQSCSYLHKETQVCQFGPRKQFLAAILKSNPHGLVALIDLGQKPPATPKEIPAAPAKTCPHYLIEMLRLLAKNFHIQIKADQQIFKIGTELARVYEELVLLHRLNANMKLTEADTNYLQLACDSLTDLVTVEGIAILLEREIDGEKRLTIAAGSGLIDIDERMASILHSRLTNEINSGKDALLDSEVDAPFKYQWPDEIKSIIAVPLYKTDKGNSHLANATKNGQYIIGLMTAINRIDKQDFDTNDVKLFNSVAHGCAVFIENGRLFRDLEELFIGSLKALTSSIDAKDKYTRGHSERVAFISRWIAQKLADHGQPLPPEQLHKIYLAGLLHDIGKIGIDETVLRKEGKLTTQEMNCIRKHPSIGAGILREIKQMRDIVPGVLYHHERVDGKGYPQGLLGDDIPAIGKIVQLADSFDAMTSKRTYRNAKTVEQALQEIEKGLGAQFDEKIGNAFLHSDVYQLWDIVMKNSPDFTAISTRTDLSEYGTDAVGTLIK